MSLVSNARNKFITGTQLGGLPVTLITVTAGQVWRLYQAVIQLSVETNSAFVAPPINIDEWIEIQGGDILTAVAVTITNPSSRQNIAVGMDLGGRAIPGGTVVRVTGSALPANTVARLTAGLLYGTS